MKKIINYLSKIAFVAKIIMMLAGTSVGKPTDKPKCENTCNLQQGFCEPDGRCTCYPGWEGPDCNMCTRAPGCINGTCNQSWECICKEGFGGRHCHLDMQFCERHRPCQNGGICTNRQGSYECACPVGFTGKNCQATVKPAAILPQTTIRRCLNGGTCIFKEDIAGCQRCACPPGYAGKRCETLVNMCITRPCANGGSCHDLRGEFRCECASGYIGRYCTEDVNECAVLGDACANGASCINTHGSYRCICTESYNGMRCEEKITPIVSITRAAATTTATTTQTNPEKSSKIGALSSNDRTSLLKKIFSTEEKKSANIKVTHIVRQVEVKSSNSEVSIVKQVMNDRFLNQDVSPDQASVSIVQAVTFALLGVAVALFIGISISLWIYCAKKRRLSSPSYLSGLEAPVDKTSLNKLKRPSNRSSDIVEKQVKVTHSARNITGKAVPPSYRPSSGLVVRTVTPSQNSKDNRQKVRAIDCQFVQLPQGSTAGAVTATGQTNSFPDFDPLSHPPNYSFSS